jgi:hypothetical protein
VPDYRPHAYEYQQLIYGGVTGPYDCTAWCGAWLTDAHTLGKTHLSGRAIRLASDEPNPDDDSPGLNARQVDDAIYKLTSHKVDLQLGGDWTPKTNVQKLQQWHYAGRPMMVAVIRGRLGSRVSGLLDISPFQGAHQVGLIFDDGKSWLFDPLSKIYLPVTPSDVWYGAAYVEGSSYGSAYALVGRDIVPSHYEVLIDPAPERFWAYRVVDNKVVSRRSTVGIDKQVRRDCTRVASYPYGTDQRRNLVKVLGEGGLATSSHPYVSPDASAIHYRGVLP